MRAIARLGKLTRIMDYRSRNLMFVLRNLWHRDYWVGIHAILITRCLA